MRPIFLIGFMCSGKTTLGRALAKALDMRFVDLDNYIEDREGRSVREIFADSGEAYFRRLEREALREMCLATDVLVACGGGTPCQPGAMDMMNAAGVTIMLRPSEQRLVRRLMAGRHKRPLLADIANEEQMLRRVTSMLDERHRYYMQAQHIFDSTLLETPAEIDASVDEFKRRFIDHEVH